MPQRPRHTTQQQGVLRRWIRVGVASIATFHHAVLRSGGNHKSGLVCAVDTYSSSSSSTSDGRRSEQQVAVIDADGTVSNTAPISSSSSAAPRLECGIWLAPSSLPNTGLGMYAGTNYSMGDFFQKPLGEIAIPVVDISWHNLDPNFAYLWDSYLWDAGGSGRDFPLNSEGYDKVDFASPGFGSVANSFLPLQNVHHWNPQWMSESDIPLHRSRDPGAGACSLYGNRRWEAMRDIGTGEELFVSYGEHWFETRTSYLGPVPLTNDLNRATTLFAAYAHLRNQSRIPDMVDRAWDAFVRNNPVYRDSRVFGAFHHDDPEERRQLFAGKTLTDIRIEQSKRDDDWLHEHGVCGDHLSIATSTLPQAGMGAFASRDLPRGTIVATLPMVHIPDRQVFDMHHVRVDGDGRPRPRPDLGVRGVQLMTNYCFGHRQSSMLLCPYGPQAPYINHNQSEVNVRLVWSDSKRGNHQPHILEMPPEALDSTYAKLSMDVVAIQDIQQGDEVFLDYGDDWEKAWVEHVRTWQPVPGADDYVDAVTLNRDVDSPLLTAFELQDRPRPNVELKCNDAFVTDQWEEYYPDRMEEFFEETNGEDRHCEVLRYRQDEENDQYLYTALMYNDEPDDTDEIDSDSVEKLIDVPRDAFTYFNRPYTTDMFLANAFRHDIRIPDDLFPEAWRNRA